MEQLLMHLDQVEACGYILREEYLALSCYYPHAFVALNEVLELEPGRPSDEISVTTQQIAEIRRRIEKKYASQLAAHRFWLEFTRPLRTLFERFC